MLNNTPFVENNFHILEQFFFPNGDKRSLFPMAGNETYTSRFQ